MKGNTEIRSKVLRECQFLHPVFTALAETVQSEPGCKHHGSGVGAADMELVLTGRQQSAPAWAGRLPCQRNGLNLQTGERLHTVLLRTKAPAPLSAPSSPSGSSIIDDQTAAANRYTHFRTAMSRPSSPSGAFLVAFLVPF